VTLLELLDWRRQVAELYSAVRAERHHATAHSGWVAVRDRLYAEHPCSPVVPEAFPGLHVAPYDPAWRAEVHLEPASPLRLEAEAGPGGPVPFERVGVLRTPWGPLDAWRLDAWGGGLWVPVRDAGSGVRSYRGGRYLLDTAEGADLGPGADGGLVVDLNFLYAPHCAHDPRRACPLPPAGNVLDVVVPTGELLSEPLTRAAKG
jgi:uncharacterized protein (DUF1684 family)